MAKEKSENVTGLVKVVFTSNYGDVKQYFVGDVAEFEDKVANQLVNVFHCAEFVKE